jgi:hypothetical protein
MTKHLEISVTQREREREREKEREREGERERKIERVIYLKRVHSSRPFFDILRLQKVPLLE